MIHFFERPLGEGWVYPCSLEDLRCCVLALPEADTTGLWAVGLVPATRKDCSANARYFSGGKPEIHVYSYDASLTFKLSPHTKRPQIEWGLSAELVFGMQVERVGSRWICRWAPGDLGRFILEHVVPHEVGHHVYHRRRLPPGARDCPRHTCEQFAEDYARRRWRGPDRER